MIPYFPGLTMKANFVIFWNVIKRRKHGSNVNKDIFFNRIAEYHVNLNEAFITNEDLKSNIQIIIRVYCAKRRTCGSVNNHSKRT